MSIKYDLMNHVCESTESYWKLSYHMGFKGSRGAQRGQKRIETWPDVMIVSILCPIIKVIGREPTDQTDHLLVHLSARI